MSNKGLIIEERSRDIGGFLVGRFLPFRKKRMVGPFIFIDHMGPSVISPEKPFDIGPHPHIGLSTLTYLLEGEIMHRDSLGSVQLIKPGEVNWMTAGKGIVHSERVPEDRRGDTYRLHGYQVWVALPEAAESIDPQFTHIESDHLPKWVEGGLNFCLVAGEFNGRKSPVPVFSPLYMLDICAESKEDWSLDSLYGEKGICVVEGVIEAEGEKFKKGNLLVAKPEELCKITIESGARVLVFGGEPFEKVRHIWWNFVSSERSRIDQAKSDWDEERFPEIPGEEDRIPLPAN